MVRAPYRVAIRLIGLATLHWAEIDGEAAARGIEPLALRPDRFLNFIYWFTVRNATQEGREQINAELDKPLPGQAKERPSDAEQEQIRNEWATFMGQIGQQAAG